MKIIQLSDLHLRSDGRLSFHKMDTMTSLMKSINHFEALKDQPDFYVVTGDLGDHGNIASYKVINEMFKRLPRPVYIVPGNHDNVVDMSAELGAYMGDNSKIAPHFCYTIDGYPMRLIVVETIDEGKHWGKLLPEVAKWLEEVILEDVDTPTMVFTHHPPYKSGLPAMDEEFINVDEFSRILNLHNNLTLATGHLHRATFTKWKGIPTVTCPPIAMLMELDFSEEGGDAFFLSDPSYLVHRFEDGDLTSFVEIIPTNSSYSGPHKFTYLANEERTDK